jgi:hypothetical protein
MSNRIDLISQETKKPCPKCGKPLVVRNTLRFPYDLIEKCRGCGYRKKFVEAKDIEPGSTLHSRCKEGGANPPPGTQTIVDEEKTEAK